MMTRHRSRQHHAGRSNGGSKVSKFGEKTMFERPAQPEEIAPAYVFLASEPDSSFITGVVLEEMGKTTAG
jgi:NAD(P)-dependent dehydrogenase (short-subunit alcohol dehydrogenase family)